MGEWLKNTFGSVGKWLQKNGPTVGTWLGAVLMIVPGGAGVGAGIAAFSAAVDQAMQAAKDRMDNTMIGGVRLSSLMIYGVVAACGAGVVLVAKKLLQPKRRGRREYRDYRYNY